jgi:hypothetical protein
MNPSSGGWSSERIAEFWYRDVELQDRGTGCRDRCRCGLSLSSYHLSDLVEVSQSAAVVFHRRGTGRDRVDGDGLRSQAPNGGVDEPRIPSLLLDARKNWVDDRSSDFIN